ncbi:MAG TPA: hypothetical protein ENH11_04340 [Candidatus Acetothermia bacterium]|nr:hypothetical protein [Candidatus Acetothermia bacterium]
MNYRLKGILIVAVVLASFGLVALAGTADYSPATYNPAVGEDISFTACQSCLSYGAVSYDWDFDGDGVYDVSTPDPTVEHAFAEAGFVVVTLRVDEGGGRYATCRKGIYVGKTPLFAVRKVTPDKSGSVLVEITVSAYASVSAVGVEETLPIGWQWEILDAANALTKKEGQNLQILWMNPIEAGETRTISYRLYPSIGTGSPSLAGTIAGYAPELVKATICGDLNIKK